MTDRRIAHTRTSSTAGFTLTEVMVGGVVAIIGLYASLALAMHALDGNTARRDSMFGEHLAEHILATIQAEATMWTTDAAAAATPVYLSKLPLPPTVGQTTGWRQAPSNPFSTDKRVGALGSDQIFYDQGILLEVPPNRGTRYCAHWRLTWVTTDLVRAEVRVAWPRRKMDDNRYADCPATMANDVGNVASITLPAMVMRNVYVQ